MKRRDYITKAGVAAGAGVVAASTLSTPALASKKVELNSEILSELSQKSLNNNMREINKFLSNEII